MFDKLKRGRALAMFGQWIGETMIDNKSLTDAELADAVESALAEMQQRAPIVDALPPSILSFIEPTRRFATLLAEAYSRLLDSRINELDPADWWKE